MTGTEQIRELNDALRTTFRDGRVLVTRGIRALPSEANAAILRAVQAFEAFTPDDDPYGEHDFGSLTVRGHAILWKIDYHDERTGLGSEDPADLRRTTRVLTVMLAGEY